MGRGALPWLLLGTLLFPGPASGADPQPSTGESVLAPDSAPPQPATRAAAWLIVEGGDQETLYRGWPICIQLETDATTKPADQTIRLIGRGDSSPQPARNQPGVWYISPEKSAAMPAGDYVISAGGVQTEFNLADEPPSLTPEQRDARRFSRLRYALAMNDLAAARQLAREWVDASPRSAAAQVALGDARAASGNFPQALAAYTEAINLTPPGTHPPTELLTRVSEVRREMLATAAATRPSTTAPATEDAPADEIAFYKLVAEGDAARRGGKLPYALRAYQGAQRYHRDHKMKLSTGELDEKIAYTRELQQKQPAAAPRGRPPPRTQPQKPQSPGPTTRPG